MLNALGHQPVDGSFAFRGILRLWLFPTLLPLLLAAIVIAMFSTPNRTLVSWLILLGVLVGLGYISRPAPWRIMTPVLTLLMILPLSTAAMTNRIRRVALPLVLGLLALWNALNLYQTQSELTGSIPADEGAMTRLENGFYAVWADSVRIESVQRPFQNNPRFREIRFYPLAHSTFAPYTYSFSIEKADDMPGVGVHEAGSSGLIPQLLSPQGIQLYAFDFHFHLLSDYCKQHHQRQLEMNVSLPETSSRQRVRADVRCFQPLTETDSD